MAGSITTLGIGSGLDLQNILDQLKTAEKAPITTKENEKTDLTQKINAYNSVNSKLFSIKSHALSLSLESDFLKTKTSVSDEDILTATANNGIESSSHSIEVVQKAEYSSWQTGGFESADSILYQGPATGIKSNGEAAITEDGIMTIKYGSDGEQTDININLRPGMSLTDVVETVNSSAANKDEEGNPMVIASLGTTEDGDFFIRLTATNGESPLDSQIAVEGAGADLTAPDKLIKITKGVDQDNPMYLTVSPGATYEELAYYINEASDNLGVTANIVDTGTAENPFHLTLTSDKTGESNRLTVLTSLPESFNIEPTSGWTKNDEGNWVEDEGAFNAIIKVNGVQYQRQENVGISDVIPGVTLNLKKVGETDLGVQKNLDPVKENIKALIDGFNDLVSEIKGSDQSNTEDGEDSDTSSAPLADSFDMKTLISKFKSLITASVNSGSEYISLVDLGLEVNKDGTMTLDETILDQAVESNPDAVQALFIGDVQAGITGLGDIIDDGITELVSSQGIVSTEIDEAQTRIDRLDKDIEAATLRLNKRYNTMTADFARLDKTISSLNSQAQYMNSIIESFNKTTTK